jgi:hypothetical protein
MADPKVPKDPKDLNQQAPPDNKERPAKDEITDEDLEKLVGGVSRGGQGHKTGPS